ncbi:resolvase [Leisingera sp. M658]|uniref:resolvase n=1 Tax=Leisingera sp. M658 TaxID=2867015 RepID=UPI0021A7C4C6|nr:resolvase [Leisingera sp. M658]UWQ77365.1 resolvase [Leisingera sp. M658]
MAEQEFDLFGDPVRQSNGRRGRPKHVPSQENRNKVIVLLAMGWSNERIAGALHVSQPTLRTYYFSELKARDIQRDRLDAHRLMLAMEEANKGNVGAMRLLDQLISKSDLALTTGRLGDAQRKAAAKPETPGKKAQEKLNAHKVLGGDDTASDGWGEDIKPGSGMH